MDGNGALFGTLQGNTRDVLHKFTVDLPKVKSNSIKLASIEFSVRLKTIVVPLHLTTNLILTSRNTVVVVSPLSGLLD